MTAESGSAARHLAASSLAHAVWRADQMGSYRAPVIPSGHAMLDQELPHGGWPAAVLIELLQPQSGIGEIHLLRPALAAIVKSRRIALVQPPHAPSIAACAAWGLAPERLLWVKPACGADALWSAEQILRSGSCGALLCWQPHVRPEALRRLHLAAQATDTAFWMLRPLDASHNASPSPLRLALQPARGGIRIRLLKRRGPVREDSFDLPFPDMAAFPFNAGSIDHACLDRPVPAPAAARSAVPALA